MNFSYVPQKGSGWMGRFPNGSWSGMAAQIVYDGADISISQSAMLIHMNTSDVTSFLHPISAGHFMAVFYQPKASSYRNLITSVFSNSSLACFLAAWVLILLGILILSRIQVRMKKSEVFDINFVKESVSWAIATACATAWYSRPKSINLLIITLVGSYLAYFGYIAFLAGIAVNLVTELAPIQTVEQLASSNLIKFTDKLLFVPKNLFQKVGINGFSEGSQLTIQNVLTKLLINHKNGIAFITFADGFSTVFHQMSFPDRAFCDALSTVMLESVKFPTAMAVKRGSPLKNAFNFNILLMGERGFLHRLNKNYDIKTQIHCLEEPHSYRGGLGFDDIWTAFAVLAGGFVMSLLGLKFEFFAKNRLYNWRNTSCLKGSPTPDC